MNLSAGMLLSAAAAVLTAGCSRSPTTPTTVAPPVVTHAVPAPSTNTFGTPRQYQPPPSAPRPTWRTLTELEKSRRATDDQFLYRAETQKLVYAKQGRVQQLIKELKGRRYATLEADLDRVDADFFRDPANEFGYRDVIWGFAGCNTVDLGLEKYIQAWVVARSKSAWSHLTMGMYYQAEACNARGTGWSNEVSDQQWKSVDEYLAKAEPELAQARRLDPKLPPLYWTLIIHAKMTNDLDAATEAMEASKKYAPASYMSAAQYMDALSPRWLGSYEQMDGFAQSMLVLLDKNPRYWDLQGYSEAERGDVAYRDNDFNTALVHYHAALEFADHTTWLTFAGESERMQWHGGEALAFYMRLARYEKPLGASHKRNMENIIDNCKVNPKSCVMDPTAYPWYGEPGIHDPADDDPLH